jgi:hypothetical protein
MELSLKSNIVNDFKKQLIDLVLNSLKGSEDLKDCIYTPMPLTDQPNTPEIALRKGTTNEYIIYYPKHSAKYIHKLDGVIKRCEVLMGRIYERKCGREFTPEDGEFIIESDEEYEPYTKDEICIAIIILEKKDEKKG